MNAANLATVFWTIFGVVWVVTSAQTKKTQERAPSRSRMLYGAPVLLGGYLMAADIRVPWLRSAAVLPDSPTLKAVGLRLTGAGIAFAIWARIYWDRTGAEQ